MKANISQNILWLCYYQNLLDNVIEDVQAVDIPQLISIFVTSLCVE